MVIRKKIVRIKDVVEEGNPWIQGESYIGLYNCYTVI